MNLSFSLKTQQALIDGLASKSAGNEISASILSTQKLATFNYSFASQGGAIGTVVLSGGSLPANALITRTFIQISQEITGGSGATIEINATGTGDILASTAAPIVVGFLDGVSSGPAADFKQNGSLAVPVTMTIGTAALTAGALQVVIQYVLL